MYSLSMALSDLKIRRKYTVFARMLKILLIVLILAGVFLAIKNWEFLDPRIIQEYVKSAGSLAPLLFIIMFSIAAVFFIPATVMILTGGALFGPVLGSVYNISGATLGAVFAFLISRYLAQEWAHQRAGSRLRYMLDGVKTEGWKFVFLVRLAGVPYFVLNYALGLTPVRLLPYTFATIGGIAPATCAVTYAGYVGYEAISGESEMAGKVITALALVAASALIPVVLRIVRRRPGEAWKANN
jgi:uncharacterized membrane protein YdjX (TVP38/TMEM64 family)